MKLAHLFICTEALSHGRGASGIDDSNVTGHFNQSHVSHVGAISGKETGFTWYSVLSPAREEVSMSYRVKFSAGFDWTKGGKLPGLCGGGMSSTCRLTCQPAMQSQAVHAMEAWQVESNVIWMLFCILLLYSYVGLMRGCRS